MKYILFTYYIEGQKIFPVIREPYLYISSCSAFTNFFNFEICTYCFYGLLTRIHHVLSASTYAIIEMATLLL